MREFILFRQAILKLLKKTREQIHVHMTASSTQEENGCSRLT